MRFSTFAILSVVASTSAFVPVANRANVVAPFATRQSKTPLFSLADLESKLLSPPEPVKAEKAKPAPKPKPAPTPKAEKPKPAPKAEVVKEAPVVVKPPPKPQVPAVEVKGSKKSGYSLETGIPETPKKVAPSVIKFEKAKPVAKVDRPKTPKAPKAPVEAEPNAGLGVFVGGAPLVLAPLVALVAGRDILAKTAARREVIQKEIAAFEAAQAKKKIQSAVDGSGVTKAAVRTRLSSFSV
jgi:hypothetical protein